MTDHYLAASQIDGALEDDYFDHIPEDFQWQQVHAA
jgi:hypothetical protein